MSKAPWMPLEAPNHCYLCTKRLSLVAPKNHMVQDVFNYARKNSFVRVIESKPLKSVEQAEQFLQELIGANNNQLRRYWAIRFGETGKMISTLGFIHDHSLGDKTMEFGCRINPTYLNTEIFQEAATMALNYGFRTMGLQTVLVKTRSYNVRAIKSIENLDLKFNP